MENKICTSLEQSKKLSEFLTVESADMFYYKDAVTKEDNPRVMDYSQVPKNKSMYFFPCWSLAALLSVLPFHLIVNNHSYAFSMVKGFNKNGETYAIKYAIFNTTFYLHLTDFYNNPIDACYEMIIRLNELKML